MEDDKNPNRKTKIPIKGIPRIVNFLIENCDPSEIEFMAGIAGDPKKLQALRSIFTRLTDFNLHEVFYNRVSSAEDLMGLRDSKRGEVAGLKAFQMACVLANKKINEDIK